MGLDFVNYGFGYIINNHSIKHVINNIQNSVTLSTLFGVLSTAIIQSSSGIISIVEQMYSSNIISLPCSIAIMLGANIGTTFTGYLATINSSKESRQIINLNLLFNVLGVLVFIILFNPFASFINSLQNKYFLHNIKLTIAFSHFIFNLISVVLAYVFFDLFESFITKKVDKKEKNDIILS